MKDQQEKQKFVVQRMFGVESDTPEQAIEMTTSKTKGVTSISINVQPARPTPVQPPLGIPPAGTPVGTPAFSGSGEQTAARNKFEERKKQRGQTTTTA